MPALPDAALRTFLARGVRRARVRTALIAGAIGILAGAAIVAVWTPDSFGLAMLLLTVVVTFGAILGAVVSQPSPLRIAVLLERQVPASRNLILTAAEIAEGKISAARHITDRVYRDAEALVGSLDVLVLWPLRRVVIVAAVAAIGSAAVIGLSARRAGPATTDARPTSENAAQVHGVEIEITPPAYVDRPSQVVRDPARVEALAGSRLHLTVNADAGRIILDTVTGSHPLAATAARTFTADVLADGDGYLAITPISATGTSGDRRLIGLTVTPDRAPRVRVTAPGRDLAFPHGRQVLQVSLDADDDFALDSLGLRFTRVAGSGESFTFTEGETRVDVTRSGVAQWQGRAAWALAPLGLEPGDVVIYRGFATDKRPGAPRAESDPFIIEIASAGSLPSEGFAIDDRENKYAISQQMVIVKTEQLLSGRASMTADDVRRESISLAAEQRQVRAEFVFMMGGELADAGLDPNSLNEEIEAAGEEDLAAGRLANQGRLDLLRAIRSMSRAAARLADPDPAAALPLEKAALVSLQRAFSRSRYILRTLNERERLDLSRRLTGSLAALARDLRPAAESAPPPRVIRIRQILAAVAALAGAEDNDQTFSNRALTLAQDVLHTDPSSPWAKDAAAALAEAVSRRGAARQAALDRVATGLASAVRLELGRDPARHLNPELDALAGALADALRREGRQR